MLAVALYVITATSLALQAPSQTPPQGAPQANTAPDPITVTGKKFCKREMRLGSITPVRVCRSAAQTKEEARAQERMRRQLDNIQRESDRCVAYPSRCGIGD